MALTCSILLVFKVSSFRFCLELLLVHTLLVIGHSFFFDSLRTCLSLGAIVIGSEDRMVKKVGTIPTFWSSYSNGNKVTRPRF